MASEESEPRARDRLDEPRQVAIRLTRWLSMLTMAPPGALALAQGLREGTAAPALYAMTATMLASPLVFFAVRRAPSSLQAWVISVVVTAVAWLGLLHFGPGMAVGAVTVTAAVSWTLFFGRAGMIGGISAMLAMLAVVAWADTRGALDLVVGGQRDVVVWLRIWVAVAGNLVFVCGVTHAVSSRYRRLLVAERLARRQAEEAGRARDEFLLLASHELRTPLTSILLLVQLIGAGKSLDERVLSSLERQVRRLDRLVRTMIDVTSLDGGRPLVREEVELGALARRVIAELGAATRCSSELSLRAPDEVRGEWDRALVEQLVAQVVGNAIKFGGGGAIDVSVEGRGREARVLVRDRGAGISAADRAQVFERFRRGVSWTQQGGLGLGLYLALQIARLHQGDILLDAEPGKGCTFTIVLPRHAPEPPLARVPRAAPPHAMA